jgi:chemotaxis protein MotB
MNKLAIILFLVLAVGLSSCVSKKEYESIQAQLARQKEEVSKRDMELNRYAERLADCERRETALQGRIDGFETQVQIREEQIEDLKKQRDQQATQVGDLTVLSQSANQNIDRTLAQLETKDKYIRLLQAAKSKADSINLALAVNL